MDISFYLQWFRQCFRRYYITGV